MPIEALPDDVLRAMCSEREALFVLEYLKDLNATKAAARATYSPKSARQAGGDLRAKPYIGELIRRELSARATRTRCDADAVLRQWWDIANVDPNELVELRRVNCRFCWGSDHEYQRTQAERDRDKEQHDLAMAAYQAQEAKRAKGEDVDEAYDPDTAGEEWKGKKKPRLKQPAPWKERGGVGFQRWADPDPECPECGGEGVVELFFKDSRDMSPAARMLYEGAGRGPKGELHLVTASRENARTAVAKHLGMFIERHEDVTPLTREERKARVLELAREGARRKQDADGRRQA